MWCVALRCEFGDASVVAYILLLCSSFLHRKEGEPNLSCAGFNRTSTPLLSGQYTAPDKACQGKNLLFFKKNKKNFTTPGAAGDAARRFAAAAARSRPRAPPSIAATGGGRPQGLPPTQSRQMSLSFAPSGLGFHSSTLPTALPWAVLFRPFGAAIGRCSAAKRRGPSQAYRKLRRTFAPDRRQFFASPSI